MPNILTPIGQTFTNRPNIAATYGPYASIAAAHAALSDDNLNIIGMTVGIQVDANHIEEYWYQGGTTQAHLVKKQVVEDIPASALAGDIPASKLSSGVQTSLGKADTAYQKPGTGIPASDLASAVQTSLGKADTAFQKPGTGIPASDLASAVQTSLGKADTAVQPADIAALDGNPTGTSADGHVSVQVTEVDGVVNGVNVTTNDIASASALADEVSRAQGAESALDAAKADKATTLYGYGISDAYTKAEVNNLVSTPHQQYVTVATKADLDAITTGSADTIYRVSNYDGTQVDATKYAEYAWDGTQFMLLSVKSAVGEVFDVSEYNSGATYGSLDLALAAVPASVQRGGMSIKFISSTSGQYEQYRLMSAEWSEDVNDWQGVDEEPTAGSENLANSRGLYKSFKDVSKEFNCVARYSGTTGTGYAFVQEVSIPSGVVVRNTGTGRVVLYDIKSSSSPNSLDLQGGETKVTTFAITWIKGRSATDLPYNIFVYADKDSITTSNGTLIKTAVENNASAIASLNDAVSVIPNKVGIKCGKNLLDLNDPYYVEGKSLSPAGNLLTSQNYDVSGYIKVDASTTYHLSGNGDSALVASDGVNVGYYTNDKILISTEAGAANKTNFTTPSSCAYMRASVKKTELSKAMIEKGSIRGEYNVYSPIEGYLSNAYAAIDELDYKFTQKDNDIENDIKDVKEEVNTNSILNSSQIEINRTLEGRYISDPTYKSLSTNEAYDAVVFGPIPDGKKIQFKLTCSNNPPIKARFQDGSGFTTDISIQNITDVILGEWNSVTIPTGMDYLVLIVNHGTTPTVNEVEYVKDAVDELNDEIGDTITQITNFTIKEYNLDRNENLGKFGTVAGRYRGIVAVYAGERFIIKNTGASANVCYAFVDTDAGEPGGTVPVVSGTSVSIVGANNQVYVTIPNGCTYLLFNTGSGFHPELYSVSNINDRLIAVERKVEQNAEDIKPCIGALGKDATIVMANDLSSDLTNTSFPYCNKFGDKYQFGCKVTSFSGIKICRGYETYRSRWFEIDGTNVYLKGYQTSTTTIATVAHGLTIEKMLNVNINITSDGKALFMMQTLGGSYSHEFSSWGYDANGVLKVINNGSTLSDCVLTAVNAFFSCPVWVFGSSFEGVSSARWPGQMKEIGYFNYLLNGLAGRSGGSAMTDFQRALAYGSPKYVYWPNRNNANDSVTESNLDTMMALCKDNGITLITYLPPDTPSTNSADVRTYIEGKAVTDNLRYVNGYAALCDPSKTWSEGVDTWYDGFLDTSEDPPKHPTVNGAKALAMQFCLDFPEIMQYSKTGEGDNAPDYGGGDE